ncbi:hypothetical protein ACTXI0_04130 [Arthrobacter rhombi]|uniref:hypothetical protein n=1 Tax=Arthrobacter rhombi TaxID=71253 RepID=UPI003FCFC7EF
MSIFDQLSGVEGPAVPKCSRKGCRLPARWQLLWNNPRIHTPERRKIWLACTDHREWLTTYLTERGLFKESQPLPADAQEG